MNKIAEKCLYGTTSDGVKVHGFRLKNSSLDVLLIEYGARIAKLDWHDDSDGFDGLIWSCHDLAGFEKDTGYMGALVGPVANRIGDSAYIKNGQRISLTANEGVHHLHGGPSGLHQKIWQGELVCDERGPSVEMTTVHQSGTDGYQGNLFVRVRYTITSENALLIETCSFCDEVRPVSLTSHAYFSLSSDGADQQLSVFSNQYLLTDDSKIPTGNVGGVLEDMNGSIDRRQVNSLNLDHAFLYPQSFDGVQAQMKSAKYCMEVSSDQPVVQIYIATDAEGRKAVCFEPHGYVDAVNQPTFPDSFVYPEQLYRTQIKYQFRTTEMASTSV